MFISCVLKDKLRHVKLFTTLSMRGLKLGTAKESD